MNINSKLYSWLWLHPFICFLLMTISFVAFGYMTLDLVRVVSANTDFVIENGWRALQDGGLQQMFELWLGALAAMVCYLAFKLCEQVLVHLLSYQNRTP